MRLLTAAIVGVTLVAAPRDRIETVGSGQSDPLTLPAGARALVLLFTSTDCPISNRYAPEVQRIVAAFGSKGVLFRLVYPNPADGDGAIRAHMAAFSYRSPIQAVRDPKQALAKSVGATVTPEVAVFDGTRIVYRGRIDDRYVELGVERPAPTRRDLADALTAILEGRRVAQATTQAIGCVIADFTR